MLRAWAVACVLCWTPFLAHSDARLTQLVDLLRLDAYIEILREEGLAEFPELAQGFLGAAPDTVMMDQITRVYDAERLRETVRQRMAQELTAEQIEAVLIFVGSTVGQRIISLEVAARRPCR